MQVHTVMSVLIGMLEGLCGKADAEYQQNCIACANEFQIAMEGLSGENSTIIREEAVDAWTKAVSRYNSARSQAYAECTAFILTTEYYLDLQEQYKDGLISQRELTLNMIDALSQLCNEGKQEED